jgi:hypothetical protein
MSVGRALAIVAYLEAYEQRQQADDRGSRDVEAGRRVGAGVILTTSSL